MEFLHFSFVCSFQQTFRVRFLCVFAVCVFFVFDFFLFSFCSFFPSLSYTFIGKCSIIPSLFLLFKKILINISSASRCGCKSCNTSALISPAEMCVLCFVMMVLFFFFLVGLSVLTRFQKLTTSRLRFRYDLCVLLSPFFLEMIRQ